MKRKLRMVWLMILLLLFSVNSAVIAQESTTEEAQTQEDNLSILNLEDGDYHIRLENGEILFWEPMDTDEEAVSPAYEKAEPMTVNLADGEYSIELSMAGGSGKASIVSPALMTIKDKKAYAHIQWSSPNYDYMIVAGEKLMNQSEEGMNSVYDIPILCMDDEMPVIADTTAMGTPHEVNYSLTFFSESIGSKSALPQEAAKRVILLAVLIIVGGGILNHYVNKKNQC